MKRFKKVKVDCWEKKIGEVFFYDILMLTNIQEKLKFEFCET